MQGRGLPTYLGLRAESQTKKHEVGNRWGPAHVNQTRSERTYEANHAQA